MKLYKYRYGSKRDLESLKKDYFYAPHSSKLNDPCENLFSTEIINTVFDRIRSSTISIINVQTAFDQLCIQMRNVGIYSLSKSVVDELLWAYYADSHTGFCIEYDLEVLNNFVKLASFFDVDYQDSVPELSLLNILDPLNEQLIKLLKITSGTKSKAWAHEKESRIILNNSGKFEYDFRAVKAIYFGLRMAKTEQELAIDDLPDDLKKVSQEQVMFELRGRGIKYYQVELKSNSYEFTYHEIEDLYKEAEQYKKNIGDIPKSMIDYSGYGWNVPEIYFDKVAEIVRRDPYFYEINSIHVHKEQSNARREPIIFAGFLKAKDNYNQIKKYYSLSEIDRLYEEIND